MQRFHQIQMMMTIFMAETEMIKHMTKTPGMVTVKNELFGAQFQQK